MPRGLHDLGMPYLSLVGCCERQHPPRVLRQAGCSLPPPPWVLWQDPGTSWRILPFLKKSNREVSQGPHCPLGGPTLIFDLYFIKVKSIDLWGHPHHHAGLWVLLWLEAPSSLGHDRCSCSTPSQALGSPQAVPSLPQPPSVTLSPESRSQHTAWFCWASDSCQ